MKDFEELKALIQDATAPRTPGIPRLVVSKADSVPHLVHALRTYFRRDRKRVGVTVYVGTHRYGYLARGALHNAAASQKGLGGADHGMLPGLTTFNLYELRCPVCGHGRIVTKYDFRRPPRCPRHPRVSMLLVAK